MLNLNLSRTLSLCALMGLMACAKEVTRVGGDRPGLQNDGASGLGANSAVETKNALSDFDVSGDWMAKYDDIGDGAASYVRIEFISQSRAVIERYDCQTRGQLSCRQTGVDELTLTQEVLNENSEMHFRSVNIRSASNVLGLRIFEGQLELLLPVEGAQMGSHAALTASNPALGINHFMAMKKQ